MPLALAALALLQAPPSFELSPGPFERTWALVDPRVGARLPDGLPLGEPESDETWRAWAERLEVCRAGEPAERAEARLWLAVLSARQGRSDDAWEHLAHAGEAPGGLRAVLPLVVPGVAPADLAAWPALPAGARLAPLTPPPSVPAREVLLGIGRVREGHARASGFQVGAAHVALALRVEGDGVQLELSHTGGGAAELELVVPVPPDFTLWSVHVDWESVAAPGGAVRVALAPGGDPVTVYGRYRPRRIEWPTSVPADLNAQLERDGLCLWLAPDAGGTGLRAGLAVLLGVEVRAWNDIEPPALGLVLDRRDADAREEKLAGIVSLAERFALAR
ncbi:MAG TPA: hypothetical protein VMT18_13205 [Planctomycetota bacterium]|nr:hypothetical protein [Planctomycetota bacterium]